MFNICIHWIVFKLYLWKKKKEEEEEEEEEEISKKMNKIEIFVFGFLNTVTV